MWNMLSWWYKHFKTASQVQLWLGNFIKSLEEPFFSHLVGHTSVKFSEVVVAGCRIKDVVSAGKLQAEKKNPITRGVGYKGKESTVSVVNTSNMGKPQAILNTSQNPQIGLVSQNQPSNFPTKRKFTRISVPLSQVLAKLRTHNLINVEIPKSDYKPKNFNPEVKCEYHLGQVSYPTDSC